MIKLYILDTTELLVLNGSQKPGEVLFSTINEQGDNPVVSV